MILVNCFKFWQNFHRGLFDGLGLFLRSLSNACAGKKNNSIYPIARQSDLSTLAFRGGARAALDPAALGWSLRCLTFKTPELKVATVPRAAQRTALFLVGCAAGCTANKKKSRALRCAGDGGDLQLRGLEGEAAEAPAQGGRVQRRARPTSKSQG